MPPCHVGTAASAETLLHLWFILCIVLYGWLARFFNTTWDAVVEAVLAMMREAHAINTSTTKSKYLKYSTSTTRDEDAVPAPGGVVATLRDDLRQMIMPWLWSMDRPPFSVEELVVIAIVLRGPSKCEEIVIWIAEMFYFYRDLELEAASTVDILPRGLSRSIMSDQQGRAREGAELKKSVEKVLGQFELGFDQPWASSKIYMIEHVEAAAFLQDRLRRQALEKQRIRRRSFPFMRLPLEIRLQVYELVVGYPPAGIVPSWGNPAIARSDAAELHVVSAQYQPFKVLDPRIYEPRRYLSSRPLSQALAILRTNQQVFREAMPLFYSLNHFALGRLGAAQIILERTPLTRRKYIGQVSMIYQTNHRSIAPGVFRLMKDMDHLQKLDLWMHEAHWWRFRKTDSTPQYPDMTSIPGIPTLRTLRLRKVKFHGDCKGLDALIPEMTAVREEHKRKDARTEQEADELKRKIRKLIAGELSSALVLPHRPKDNGVQ